MASSDLPEMKHGGAIRAYAVALLCALVGLGVTVLLGGPLGGPFFMFQFAAVVTAALLGGFGPGVSTMLISALGDYVLYRAPTIERTGVFRITSFALVSLFFGWVAARLRHARIVAEEARLSAERAEAEARAIGALQERFVAIVSHDLRNPLLAITLTAQQLRRREGVSPQAANGLARILRSTARMQSLIRDLLDFGRSRQEGGIPVRLQPAHIGALCRSALEELGAAYPGRALAVDVAGDDSADVDPGRVEQIVCNLVANALTHGAPGAPVRIGVTGADDTVRLDVTNEGAPIEPEVLRTLFEPFRAGGAPGSIGLGLYIVREIARAHGGTASVRSDGPITTFTVVFPKRAVAARPQPQSVEPAPEPTGDRHR